MRRAGLAVCHVALLALLAQQPVMANASKEAAPVTLTQSNAGQTAQPATVKASQIPFKRESAQETSFNTGLLAVLLLGMAVFAGVLALRKHPKFALQKQAAPGILSILTTQRLGPRAYLSVVEFAGSRHLIVQSEHGVQCLASAPSQSQAGSV